MQVWSCAKPNTRVSLAKRKYPGKAATTFSAHTASPLPQSRTPVNSPLPGSRLSC